MRRTRCRGALLTWSILLGVAGPAAIDAQEPSLPPGWRAITDSPGRFVPPGVEPNLGEAWNFTRMPPGWHITSGPGMILFDPAIAATGRFQIETDLFLFPDPSDQPVGLFIAGNDLDDPARAAWLALVVKRDGTAGVIQRLGPKEELLVPYRRIDSLAPHPGKDSQRILLTVDAEGDSLRFSVNRARVGAVGRSQLSPEGQFGFRIGRGLNLHVIRLDHTRRIAPARVR